MLEVGRAVLELKVEVPTGKQGWPQVGTRGTLGLGKNGSMCDEEAMIRIIGGVTALQQYDADVAIIVGGGVCVLKSTIPIAHTSCHCIDWLIKLRVQS